MNAIICCKCKQGMREKKRGIIVAKWDVEIERIRSFRWGDIWCCPNCKAEIVTNLDKKAFAYAYSSNLSKVFKKIYDEDSRTIVRFIEKW